MTAAFTGSKGYTRGQIHTVFIGLIFLMFLGTVDQAIVAPALTTIGHELGNVGLVFWVVTAFLLTSAASTPLAGRLSDIYGRPVVVTGALSALLAGSFLCAVAWSLDGLIIGRCVQGLGGGALMALPNTIVGDILSPRERGRYQAYISGTYAVSSLAGPLLGGFLTEHASWRAIFWLQIPLIVIAWIISHLTLRQISFPRRYHAIDYGGSLLMVVSCTCLLLMLTLGGKQYAWVSPEMLLLCAGFLVAGVTFVYWQRVAPEPLLPSSVLYNPVMAVTSAGAVLVLMVNTAFAVYFPSYLQSKHGISVSQAGVILSIPLFGVVLGSYLSGQYVRTYGDYKLPPLAAVALAASMFLMLALVGDRIDWLQLFVVTLLLGVGLGGSLVPMMISSQNSVSVHDMGIATATHTFFRALGGSFGVAIFSATVIHEPARNSSVSLTNLPAVDISGGGGFSMFFAGCTGILILAWLVLSRLPVIPLRTTAASLEAND
jgi:MFS family permease